MRTERFTAANRHFYSRTGTRSTKKFSGIVWFRLPLDNDTRAWSVA
nr:DUF3142 domain-containing protein [Klebsiella variicola]